MQHVKPKGVCFCVFGWLGDALYPKSSYTVWWPSCDTYTTARHEQSLESLWPAWRSINRIKHGRAHLCSQCCWKHPHREGKWVRSVLPRPLRFPWFEVLCVFRSMWCYAHSTFNQRHVVTPRAPCTVTLKGHWLIDRDTFTLTFCPFQQGLKNPNDKGRIFASVLVYRVYSLLVFLVFVL